MFDKPGIALVRIEKKVIKDCLEYLRHYADLLDIERVSSVNDAALKLYYKKELKKVEKLINKILK